MKLVIFGLTISSSWGNGHATLWRALSTALARRGHHVVFFERDVVWYAEHRDFWELPKGELILYGDWAGALPQAQRHLKDADVAMITSYCPDGVDASRLVLDFSTGIRCFYDLDTPVTLSRLDAGEFVSYLPPEGLGGFDLVLSYTGGSALEALQNRLHAKRVAPLYGSVDPDFHKPAEPQPHYAADLSYLGTYAEDRQRAVEELLLEPARRLPGRRFLIGGAQYPHSFPWTGNIFFLRHLPPSEHPAFFSSSRMTLNVTRKAMAEMGYCPSGRLFEAAACGVPIVSDAWEGLDGFYTPGSEILLCHDREDVIRAIHLSDAELRSIAESARERTLAEHTATHRVMELEGALEGAYALGV